MPKIENNDPFLPFPLVPSLCEQAFQGKAIRGLGSVQKFRLGPWLTKFSRKNYRLSNGDDINVPLLNELSDKLKNMSSKIISQETFSLIISS
jgi:hypothetical protein